MDSNTVENDEISLKELTLKIKDWFNYVISKWKVIILVSALGALFGVSYSLIKKPTYVASLSFALEDEKGGGFGSALGLASTLGLDLGGSGGGMFSAPNLTALFKSRSMVEKTLLMPAIIDGKKISLAEMYIINNGLRDKWESKPNLANVQFLPNSNRRNFTRVQDSILGTIYTNLSKEGLSVDQKDKKITIIDINFSSTNELFSKYFCEGLAKQVSNFYVDTKSKKARLNMSILQRQTDSIRGELNGAITGVAAANDNTFNLNPALNIRRAPSAKRQVDVEANTAILTELVKQTELAKVTLRRETPLIQIIDTPILPLEKKKFGIIKGILIGGFLFGFLTVLVLIIKREIKKLNLE